MLASGLQEAGIVSKITVHAGDFLRGDGYVSSDNLILRTKDLWLGETIPISGLRGAVDHTTAG